MPHIVVWMIEDAARGFLDKHIKQCIYMTLPHISKWHVTKWLTYTSCKAFDYSWSDSIENLFQCEYQLALVNYNLKIAGITMGLLPDTHNCGLSMRRECREHFPRHRFQRKPLVSDPTMHHGTCITHVPWCMSGSLPHGGGENFPGIPGACATHNFTYLTRDPWLVYRALKN